MEKKELEERIKDLHLHLGKLEKRDSRYSLVLKTLYTNFMVLSQVFPESKLCRQNKELINSLKSEKVKYDRNIGDPKYSGNFIH
jgi:hypothetical protein